MSTAASLFFDGQTNFRNWAMTASYHFRVNNVWATINGDNKPPTQPPATAGEAEMTAFQDQTKIWIAENDKAISALLVLLHSNVITSLRSLRTASEMWTRLNSLYTKGSDNHMNNFKMQLFNFKMRRDEDVRSMQARFEEICDNLDRFDEPVSEVDKIARVLNSIPNTWRYFISAWESVPAADQRYHTLIARLLREEELNESAGIPSTSSTALVTRSDRMTCSCSCHASGCPPCNQPKKQTSFQPRHQFQPKQQASQPDVSLDQRVCTFCNKSGHVAAKCYRRKNNTRVNGQGHASGNSQRPQANITRTDQPDRVHFAFISSAHEINNTRFWVADSGATDHMCCRREWFTEIKFLDDPIQIIIGNRQTINGTAIGTVRQHSPFGTIELHNVLFAPELGHNLFSIGRALDNGCRQSMDASKLKIFKDKTLIASGQRDSTGLWRMDFTPCALLAPGRSSPSASTPTVANLARSTTAPINVWHARLGHASYAKIVEMSKGVAVTGVDCGDQVQIPTSPCEPCAMGKKVTDTFVSSDSRAKKPGELTHFDTFTAGEPSVGGARYGLVVVDDYTSLLAVYFLKTKDEAAAVINNHFTFIKASGHCPLRARSDNAAEYKGQEMNKVFSSHGVHHEFSTPYTPQQNGRAERQIRTVVEMARSLLSHVEHRSLWAEATATAAYIRNRIPLDRLNHLTPFEVWFGRKPNLSHLRIWGSRALVLNQDVSRKKFAPKCDTYTLVGYEEGSKSFRVWRTGLRDVRVVKHIEIIEPDLDKSCNVVSRLDNPVETTTIDSLFTFPSFAPPCVRSASPSPPLVDRETEPPLPIEDDFTPIDDDQASFAVDQSSINSSRSDSVQLLSESFNNQSILNSSDHSVTSSEAEVTAVTPTVNPFRRQRELSSLTNGLIRFAGQLPAATSSVDPVATRTRGRSDSTNRNTRTRSAPRLHLSRSTIVPNSIDEARTLSDWSLWKAACDDEMSSLVKLKTWTMVDASECKRRPISCRWLFRIKSNPDGTVARYKARLVVRGFEQKAGVDYDDTFAPVVALDCLRLFLSIAASNNYEICQFDVKTAFLNGELNHPIYMSQPPGYGDGTTRICFLQKSLYGLKQAPAEWNRKMDSFLESFGLHRSNYDRCVYFGKGVSLVLYVDDGLIAGIDRQSIERLLSAMSNAFEITHGDVSYYLGLEIDRDRRNRTLHIHQEGYIGTLLDRFSMADCNPASTPAETSLNLSDCEPAKPNSFPYREIVGGLMYLSTGSRPDISFTVGLLSRQLDKPSLTHWNAAKRVLRYLSGTRRTGIRYSIPKNIDLINQLISFSDADFAACLTTRKSTSGVVLSLNGGPVTWFSRKQSNISTSTTEAEYVAAHDASREISWIRQLLAELGCHQIGPSVLHVDNSAAEHLINNPSHHRRTKHIDVKFHFVHHLVQNNLIRISHVSSSNQLADIFTKSLPKVQFLNICKLLNISS
jgi:hypothetical protein